MGDGSLAHQSERDTVKVTTIGQFDPAKVETHDGRIMARNLLDIRPLQRVVLPVGNNP